MANVLVTIRKGFAQTVFFILAISQTIICCSFKSPLSARASAIFVSLPDLGWRKKSKVMTTIIFIKQSFQLHDKFIQSQLSLLLCNWIFTHLVSILIKDINQYTLSCYCRRGIPIFRSFFTPTTRKSVPPARHIRSSPCWQTDITTWDPGLW